jgi:hypothetical protein
MRRRRSSEASPAAPNCGIEGVSTAGSAPPRRQVESICGQTLGNLIAGMVLIAARPFRVGDRVRLQAGAVAGTIEGVVGQLGLLYTTFARGQDSVMVPNNVVLSAAVVPLREPAAVDLRARLRPDVRPSNVQSLLEDAVSTPVRGEPRISLEELDSMRSWCACPPRRSRIATARSWPTRSSPSSRA